MQTTQVQQQHRIWRAKKRLRWWVTFWYFMPTIWFLLLFICAPSSCHLLGSIYFSRSCARLAFAFYSNDFISCSRFVSVDINLLKKKKTKTKIRRILQENWWNHYCYHALIIHIVLYDCLYIVYPHRQHNELTCNVFKMYRMLCMCYTSAWFISHTHNASLF